MYVHLIVAAFRKLSCHIDAVRKSSTDVCDLIVLPVCSVGQRETRSCSEYRLQPLKSTHLGKP